MLLRDLLFDERIAILVEPGTRAAVLDAAARLLADPTVAGAGSDGGTDLAQMIGDRLRQRERLASTAIGHGVAIPHARIAGLDRTRGTFLRLGQPVDFNAADGLPVDLVLALAVPEHHVQQHLELLADLAESFADPGWRAQLRAAPSIKALRRLLADPSASPTAESLP